LIIKDKLHIKDVLPLTIKVSGFLFGGKEKMKTITQKNVRAIREETAEAFNEQIAEILNEYGDANINYITSGAFLGAYVEYETTKEIPETLAEKYELNNDKRYCHECPYFQRTQDKRYKWHYCVQKQKRVTECQGACETYYQLLEDIIQEAAK